MSQRSFSKRQRIALGTVRILLAFVFLGAGLAKLAGLEPMIKVFDELGLGQWFRYVTGVIEVGSALLLLTSRFVGVAAGLLACTMACAIFAHLIVVPGSPVPAAVLLLLSGLVAWSYRDRTRAHPGTTSAADAVR